MDRLECDRRQAQPGNGVHRCPACTQYVANATFPLFLTRRLWAGCSAAAHLKLDDGKQTLSARYTCNAGVEAAKMRFVTEVHLTMQTFKIPRLATVSSTASCHL